MRLIKKNIQDIGEFGLIKMIAKATKTDNSVICGINDDAAVLKYSNSKYLLFTTDMLIEGEHFTKVMPAEEIGHKALAVNISDIAAMGGVPTHAVISVGLPKNLGLEFINGIYRGISKLAKKFEINIVGGDTNKSSKIIINISLLGEVEKNNLVLRSGAKNGDLIFVTGALGKSFASGKHLNFMPRLEFSRALVKKYKPSSMIDISDGLVIDLGHILELSKAGAVVYEKLVPRTENAGLKATLYDGEDFELLFTLNKKQSQRFLKNFSKDAWGANVSLIGKINSRKNKILFIDKFGAARPLTIKGFTHF